MGVLHVLVIDVRSSLRIIMERMKMHSIGTLIELLPHIEDVLVLSFDSVADLSQDSFAAGEFCSAHHFLFLCISFLLVLCGLFLLNDSLLFSGLSAFSRSTGVTLCWSWRSSRHMLAKV